MPKINFFATPEIGKEMKGLSKDKLSDLCDSIRNISNLLLLNDPDFESGDYYVTENNPIKLSDDHYIITMRLTIHDINDLTAEFIRFDKVTKEEAEALEKEIHSDIVKDNDLKS